MDASQAKMFVRSLSSSAAKILVAFLLARTALDVKELHEWTGMKRETLYSGLDILRSCGMVEKQMAEHGRQVWVPAGDLLPGFQLSTKRTAELQESVSGTSALVGGGEDLKLINLNTPPTPQPQLSAKRTAGEAVELLRHTDLLFDGSFVNSKELEAYERDDVLAWCAYGFEQFRLGRSDRPAGLVRRKLLDHEPPSDFLRENWIKILPEAYLEAVGLIEYTCEFCPETFGKRADMNEHMRRAHPYVCEECQPTLAFETQADWRAHYDSKHDPYRKQETESFWQTKTNGQRVYIGSPTIDVPALDGSLEAVWQTALGALQQDMPRASFDTWVRDTTPVRYDGNSNTLVVAVRNAYARDWLTNRLTTTVAKLLVGILNQADAQVRFVTFGQEESV